VARQVASSASAVGASTRRMCDRMRGVADALRRAGYRIATSDLSVEMMANFVAEVARGEAASRDEARLRIAQLAEVTAVNVHATFEIGARTAEELRLFQHELDAFMKEIRTLEILHLTGKVESVSCDAAQEVAGLFEEINARTVEARGELAALADLAAAAHLPDPDRAAIEDALAALQRPR
jgi:hypothetical protein